MLRALMAALEKRVALDDRIGKMAANAAEFAGRIAELAAPWGDLAERPALEQASALDRIAGAHRRASERRRDLDEEIARAQTAIAEAERGRQEIEGRAAEIALAWDAPARPEGVAALSAAIRAAEDAADLRERVAREERALLRTLETDDLAEAETMLAGSPKRICAAVGRFSCRS